MPRKRKSYNEDDTAEIIDGLDEEKETAKSAVLGADLDDDESDDDEELSLEKLAEEEELEEEKE